MGRKFVGLRVKPTKHKIKLMPVPTYSHFDCWYTLRPMTGWGSIYPATLTPFNSDGGRVGYFPDPSSLEAKRLLIESKNAIMVADTENTLAVAPFEHLKPPSSYYVPKFKFACLFVLSTPKLGKEYYFRNGMPLNEIQIFDSAADMQAFILNEFMNLNVLHFTDKTSYIFFHNAQHDVRIAFPLEVTHDTNIKVEQQIYKPFKAIMSYNGRQSVAILDSFSFIPESLEKIGKSYGVKKYEFKYLSQINKLQYGARTKKKEERIHSLKSKFDNQPMTEWMKRCSLDVYITALAVKDIMKEHFELGRKKPFLSRPSLSHHDLCVDLSKKDPDLLFWIDRKKWFDLCLTAEEQKVGDNKELRKEIPPQGLAFDGRAGGRAETFLRQEVNADCYDVFSLYPTQMMRKPLPYKFLETVKDPTAEYMTKLRSEEGGGSKVYTIYARVNVPDDVHIGYFLYCPLLIGHKDGRFEKLQIKSFFPRGRFRTVINSPEIRDSKFWKCVEKIYQVDVYAAKKFARPFAMKHMLGKIKAHNDGDSAREKMHKLAANAEFGKLLETDREQYVPLKKHLSNLVRYGIISPKKRSEVQEMIESNKDTLFLEKEKGDTSKLRHSTISIPTKRGNREIEHTFEYFMYPYSTVVKIRPRRFKPKRFSGAGSFIPSYGRALIRDILIAGGQSVVHTDTDSCYIIRKDAERIKKWVLRPKDANTLREVGKLEKKEGSSGKYIAIKAKLLAGLTEEGLKTTGKGLTRTARETYLHPRKLLPYITANSPSDYLVTYVDEIQTPKRAKAPVIKRHKKVVLMADDKREWYPIIGTNGKTLGQHSRPLKFDIEVDTKTRKEHEVVCCYKENCGQRVPVVDWSDHFRERHTIPLPEVV